MPQLRSELDTIDPRAGISVGSLRDAYPTVEWRYGLTRAAIEELVAQGRAFVIITKGLSRCFNDRHLLSRRTRE